jgi:hypothetical protein
VTEEKRAMIKNLAKLDENTFTKEYVVPVFEAMGYTRSDYNGGTYEFGKDAIMVTKVPPNTNYVILIQSKRKSGISTKHALNELIVQLSQCINDGIYLTDTEKVYANEVYIACNDTLSSRDREKIFRALPSNSKVPKILDAPEFVSLVCDYSDDIKKKLLNNSDILTFSAKLEGSNQELLTAINSKKLVDINEIYSDLSFFIGHIESQSIISSPVNVYSHSVLLNVNEWNKLKPVLEKLRNKYSINLLVEDSEEIETKFNTLSMQTAENNKKIEKEIIGTVLELDIEKDRTTQHFENLGTNYLECTIEISSNKSPSILHKFLKTTQETLEFLNFINTNKRSLQKILHISKSSYSPSRLTISPFTIFDSGLDISVYGQAGAGKTTTLNQYAAYLLSKGRKDLLYIRLNTVIESYDNKKKSESDKNINLIDWAILISKSINISKEAVGDLHEFLKTCSVLILDGLDEVYSTMTNIIDDLNEFKRRFPNIQIVTSSRDCVSYLNEINFLGITLLPFTKTQLKSFVVSYFDNEKLSTRLVKKIENRNLYDVISNPLLATVACELVKQGIDSFTNENEIYDCRLKLLLDAYDKVKKINRNIHTFEQLCEVSEKLALSMHKSGIRQIAFNDALERITSHSAHSKKLNKSILEELIDPCNLIIKEAASGLLTFGHFRFQEHLVAKAIAKDRSIRFYDICQNQFWVGALVLFAQNNPIEFLIDEFGSAVYENPIIADTLHLMSSKSAIKNNRNLLDLIGLKNSFYE